MLVALPILTALYVIGLAYFIAKDMEPYGSPGTMLPVKWKWRWSLLLWPVAALSEIYDVRTRIICALKRKWS